jgi:hypothetical protein
LNVTIDTIILSPPQMKCIPARLQLLRSFIRSNGLLGGRAFFKARPLQRILRQTANKYDI